MKNASGPGFTLVEIAIVLTIMGVLIGSGILAFGSVLDDLRYKDTQRRLETISNALALYAQEHYYLPCAADPSAAPTSFGKATTTCNQFGMYAISTTTGIVPFVDLGLKENDARDGYGSYITYKVNRFYVADSQGLLAVNVNSACRTSAWIDLTAVPIRNRNPRKAKFCCSMTGTWPNDEIIYGDTSGSSTLNPKRTTYEPGLIDVLTIVSPPGQNTQAPVFILTSHGLNGAGAFLGNQTYSRKQDPANVSRMGEVLNEDSFNSYALALPHSTNRASGYFDDIVVWKTADQLISAFGRDSCARP